MEGIFLDDPIGLAIKLAIFFLLIIVNGVCVAAEFALVKVRETQLDQMMEDGVRMARYARKLVSRIDIALSVTQLGITFASLGLGWLGEPTVSAIIWPAFAMTGLGEPALTTVSFAVSFFIITAFQIVLGELVPKNIAIQAAERVILKVSLPLLIFQKFTEPFVWVLNHVANFVTHRLGYDIASGGEAAHTEDEIRVLMEESHRQGYIDKTELDFVDNVFDFADLRVREIMIPRTDMKCLYLNQPMARNIRMALANHLTRYPVCIEDKDHIVGFLHIKDLLAPLYRGQKRNLRSLLRKVMVVPETMYVSKLLKEMQQGRTQLAIVVDEYGGTSGMVTIEDILEEIVGDIQDEFDDERPIAEECGNRLYSVDGRMLLDELEDILEVKVEDTDVDTVGGWMYSRIELPPRVGLESTSGGTRFYVAEVKGMRVTRVLVKLDHDLSDEHEEIRIRADNK